MVAFPGALKGAEWTGNPVRAEIAAIAAPEARFPAGKARCVSPWVAAWRAQALNEALPKALALLPAKPVVHQAGEKHSKR